MSNKELLQQALDALETADEIDFWNKQKAAIAAIKEALAQPEQPAARIAGCTLCGFCAATGEPIQPKEKKMKLSLLA